MTSLSRITTGAIAVLVAILVVMVFSGKWHEQGLAQLLAAIAALNLLDNLLLRSENNRQRQQLKALEEQFWQMPAKALQLPAREPADLKLASEVDALRQRLTALERQFFDLPGAIAPASVEEMPECAVVLTAVPPERKISVIKEIRVLTNIGLREAKDMTESTPAVFAGRISKERAEYIKQKLEAAGATVTITAPR